MLSHRIDGIGVDCNRAADGTVDAALRDAVNEITDSKGSLQSVHWEKFQSCGDCTVYFQISYKNVSPLRFAQSKRANRTALQDGGFGLGNKDSHKPLVVTFRSTVC